MASLAKRKKHVHSVTHYYVTGSQTVTIRNRAYSEPAIVESVEKRLSWLRQNAFSSTGKGWFAAGYGAFRRLTRSNRIIVPSLEPQARFTNFVTQFNEDEPLSAFEGWMVYLDYRISKAQDEEAERKKAVGIAAINRLLPEGVEFSSISSEGRITSILMEPSSPPRHSATAIAVSLL